MSRSSGNARVAVFAIIYWTAATICLGQLSSSNLRGKVINDIMGAEVKNVRIALLGSQSKQTYVTNSGEDGRFAAVGLRPDDYRIQVSKSGYFTETVKHVYVKDGQDLNIGEIEIVAKRTISGHLQWAGGDPAVGAGVLAIPVVSEVRQSPLPVGEEAENGRADRTGRFVLGSLPPGKYVMYVFREAIELEGSDTKISLPQIFPSSGVIDLETTADWSGGSIILAAENGFRVQGSIASNTQFTTSTPVALALFSESALTPLVETRGVIGHTFNFKNIPPGHYTLHAIAADSNGHLLRSIQPVEVTKADVDDLVILFPDTKLITGKVELEEFVQGTSKGLSPVADVPILLRSKDRGSVWGTTDANGKFVSTVNISSESLEVQVPKLPHDTYIADVSSQNRSIVGPPWSIAAESEDIRFLLRMDGSVIKATVRDRGNLVRHATIVLQGEGVIRFIKINGDDYGEFSMIPPGAYDLFAFRGSINSEYLVREYTSRFRPAATPISISPGSVIAPILPLIDRETH